MAVFGARQVSRQRGALGLLLVGVVLLGRLALLYFFGPALRGPRRWSFRSGFFCLVSKASPEFLCFGRRNQAFLTTAIPRVRLVDRRLLEGNS